MSRSETQPTVAPVLSTPDTHIFEDPTPPIDVDGLKKLSDEELYIRYEIRRTVDEIRAGGWRRIALQFEDGMLRDAVRVFDMLGRDLKRRGKATETKRGDQHHEAGGTEELETEIRDKLGLVEEPDPVKLFVLADTSYGACCVDEIAAEHVNAEVVVHYGRTCLSPTQRLPVIYVYTTRRLDMEALVDVFRESYPDKQQRIILMADVPYTAHIPEIFDTLTKDGYMGLFATEVIHDPSSPLPNRTIPEYDVGADMPKLLDHQLFHIAQPPTALLLTLSSRVGAIHIYPCDIAGSNPTKAILASSAMALRRRYALLTSLSTASIFGILINTLSVKNYMHILDHVKSQIEGAGKKTYTFVVGKVNAAKIANFSEIGGWVVIGCWESSLIESKDFYRPLITPFELGLALKSDEERIWTGEWTSDFEVVLKTTRKESGKGSIAAEMTNVKMDAGGDKSRESQAEYSSEDESAPPEFDLRTGRYVSHSRPMRTAVSSGSQQTVDEVGGLQSSASGTDGATGTLVRRAANGQVAHVGGVASPGAEFLRSNRTWQGLGSDFEIRYDEDGDQGARGTLVEQGRSGVARGYSVGDQSEKR